MEKITEVPSPNGGWVITACACNGSASELVRPNAASAWRCPVCGGNGWPPEVRAASLPRQIRDVMQTSLCERDVRPTKLHMIAVNLEAEAPGFFAASNEQIVDALERAMTRAEGNRRQLPYWSD